MNSRYILSQPLSKAAVQNAQFIKISSIFTDLIFLFLIKTRIDWSENNHYTDIRLLYPSEILLIKEGEKLHSLTKWLMIAQHEIFDV